MKTSKLTAEERFISMLQASDKTLRQIDRILIGRSDDDNTIRLLSITEAARRLGVASSTVYRLLGEGSLDSVVLRRGRRRVRETDIKALVDAGKA